MPRKQRPVRDKEPANVLMAPVRPSVIPTEELTATLSDEMQKTIVRECIADYEEALQARGDWEQKRDDHYRRWRQIKEPKDFPWTDASNLMLPVTTSGVETYHPRLFQSIFGIPDPIQIEAIEQQDLPNERRIGTFLNWQIMQKMETEERWDTFIQLGEIEGTVVGKLPWKKQSRIIKERVPVYQRDKQDRPVLDSQNQPIPKLDKDGVIVTRMILKEDIVYENPFFDVPNQEDIIVPWNAKNCQDADFVIHRLWMMPDTMRRRGKAKKFQNVEKAVTMAQNAPFRNMMMDRAVQTRNEAQGVSPVVGFSNRKQGRDPVLVLECYKRIDVDGDGFEEECIFWIGVHGEVLLRGKYLDDVFEHGKRPFIEWRFLPDPNRFYGIGIPELVINVQDEIDTTHNQRIDAGTIANIPFGFYRPASGFDPSSIMLAPGTWIAVDDINDAKFGQYPDAKPSSFQEEALLIDYYERLLGVNDNLQGRPSSTIGTRATARGQNQLLQQSGVRINMTARRLRRAWDEYVWQIHQLDMQYLPPGVEFRVTNEQGQPFYDVIRNRHEIKGKFDFRHRSVIEVKTPQVERQEAQELYQLLVGHPLLAQDIEAQGELLLDLVKSYKRDNLIKIIKRLMAAGNQLPDVKTPQEEIGNMNQGVAVLPNPQEDLATHLRDHLAYRAGSEFKTLPERIKILHESHIMKTLFLFRQAKEQAQGAGEEVPVAEGRNRVAEFAGENGGVF